ncbi:MAG TPA: cell envelope integrity protein CreD, partial [bacterium]|nr:cell envelope integrity protein CreD [bacterium]
MKGRFALLLKLIFIGFMTLVMLIPTLFIMNLIHERQMRREEASSEVLRGWGGGDQLVGGPVLVLPYDVSTETMNDKGQKVVTHYLRSAYFLPEKLEIDGQLKSQTLSRGIFRIPVYQGELAMSGAFRSPDLAALGIKPTQVRWDKAYVQLSLSDLRGLRETPEVLWSGESRRFEPSATLSQSGPLIRAAVAVNEKASAYDFNLKLNLGGGKRLQFLPLAGDTHIKLKSNWPHPSFSGNFLPVHREVRAEGFVAEWKIPATARPIPAYWEDGIQGLEAQAFGAEFMLPVDIYQFTERAAKYAMLFILLTFVAFFLFEVMSKARIHPVQYLLVSAALCVFYVLLLSLSEHIDFGLAYLASAGATVLLITAYLVTVLQKKSRALLMAGILGGLYGYLFTLLRAEDFSLLMGS